jgi:hypothetical protein
MLSCCWVYLCPLCEGVLPLLTIAFNMQEFLQEGRSKRARGFRLADVSAAKALRP